MTLYDDMQKVASDILGNPNFGQQKIELVSITNAAGPNAWTPGTPTPSKILLKGVARGVSTKYVMKSLAVGTDKQVTFAVSSVVPTQAMFIDLDDIRHKIISVEAKPAVGTVVAYTCIVRKGAS